jgi:hypothetical protein
MWGFGGRGTDRMTYRPTERPTDQPTDRPTDRLWGSATKVTKAQSFGRMCGLCKRLKEESSASSRLCAHRDLEDIGGYYVVICERGELCEQQASRTQILCGNL